MRAARSRSASSRSRSPAAWSWRASPVSTTSLLVRPRCRNRPSGPTVSATWLTKAMTSWSVVRSISAIRSTSTRARDSRASSASAGDQAARRLDAGDGQLHPEHRAEPGLVGPDRAHLRERVAADHRADPAPARDRVPADVVAALDGRRRRSRRRRRRRGSRRVARSLPRARPPTRIRPPAVRHVPSASRAVPAWNTSGVRGCASRGRRGPRCGRRAAGRPGSRPPPGRPPRPRRGASAAWPCRERRRPASRARPRAAAGPARRPAAAGWPGSRGPRTARCTRAGSGRPR